MNNADNVAKKGDSSKQIRERLIDVAEGLFCEKGFDGTSVRDITSRAKCNVAAVNYHFGGKEKLYYEVFHRHMRTLRDIRIASIKRVMSQGEGEVALEQLLGAFAKAFIEPLIEKSAGQILMKLMIREILDPHLPKKMFMEEVGRPTVSTLAEAMGRVCPKLGDREIMMSILSVIGQLMHAVHINKIFSAERKFEFPIPNLTEMVEHITAFSTAGILAVAEKENKQNNSE